MWKFLPLKPVAGRWQDKLRRIDWFGLAAAVFSILFLLVSAIVLAQVQLEFPFSNH
jgi:hypothetical protein